MSTARLLIVDDDPAVGAIIARGAEASGVAALATADAATFFDRVEDWAPTMLAVDLRMPDTDGMDVLDRLALEGHHARVILMSGLGGRVLDAAARTADRKGLDVIGVLPKPFALATLKDLLTRHGEVPSQPAPPRRPVKDHTLAELAAGIRAGDVYPHFQPKVRLGDGRPVGVEALARWNSPDGPVPPNEFIGLAASGGLMGELTLEVFAASLRWLHQLHAALPLGPSSLPSVAVNLEAASLMDPTLPDQLLDLNRGLGLDPGYVVLELTETGATPDASLALDVITRLRVMGYQLSIDDFGTGYSSLSKLVELPFCELKIDRSFVHGSTTHADNRTIVQAVVSLAQRLDMTTTAEGVEDQQTQQLLLDLGCDLAQGYHFARPMTGEAALTWWLDHPSGAAG